MGAEKRFAERKQVDSIHVAEITSLSNYTQIATGGSIVDASSRGFLILVSRKDIVPSELKKHLTLEAVVGQVIALYLPQMNLDLDGTIIRANHIGKGMFELAVEFGDDIPMYWRECLVDLLPEPGELEAQ